MIRVVIELVVLCLIVGAAVSLFRLWNGQRRTLRPSAATASEIPPEGLWRATHVGNERNQTEVLVVLQVPGSTRVWDRRICAVIDNQDSEYDKRFYNAMEDARSRASLLNSMRDT